MQEDGTVVGSLREVDLVNEAGSLDELRLVMAEDLVDYAKEYMEAFEMYSRAPNRKGHLPSVLNVLIQQDVCRVAELIHA